MMLRILWCTAILAAFFSVLCSCTPTPISGKMSEMRRKKLDTIIACFKAKKEENKRVYASTIGTSAKLFDENGAEIDCSQYEPAPRSGRPYKYDQHCFFSPMNCLWMTLKKEKRGRPAPFPIWGDFSEFEVLDY